MKRAYAERFSAGAHLRDAPQEVRTFFITSVTYNRERIFRNDNLARLFLDVLFENRRLHRFLLHEFVAMPDHFHVFLTPASSVPLEKAAQYVKGGFSFRAGKEAGVRFEIWQPGGFKNHRINDCDDYEQHRTYIHQNPVEAGLVTRPEDYAYSSAFPGFELDPRPSWLKPLL